jgi:hypothetical protein
MYASHDLLQAAKTGSIATAVGSASIADFLGRQWVESHTRVWPHIQALEALTLEDKGQDDQD